VNPVLLLAALPVLAAASYLFLLTLLSRRPARPLPSSRALRVDVVVPAHDEEAGVADTVRSLLALDWPAERRRVIVVADNCTDATAARARDAGAVVWERRDTQRRGKGFALSFAYERCLAEQRSDAVVVVDADTVVSPNLLEAFATRLERGAGAVQAAYGVRNPDEHWRTRLMTLAFALFHDVRSLGRERLHLSCGLRGNGMCFSARVLREIPHDAFSVVEDVEYGLRLGEAGVRVHFAPEARVLGAMTGATTASATQRRRWEGGRRMLARRHAGRLIRRGLAGRDPVLLELAADLLVPPLARLGAAALAGTALAAAASVADGRAYAALWAWATAVAMLIAHVMRGWQLSGIGWSGLGALARSPGYLAWKAALALRAPEGRQEWIRTARN